MDTFKTVKSQIVNPSPNRDKLNRARAKLERPSITNLRRAHQLVNVEDSPPVVIPDAIGTPYLQGLLDRLRLIKTLPDTTSAPGSSINTVPAIPIKLGHGYQVRLEALKQKIPSKLIQDLPNRHSSQGYRIGNANQN